MAKQSEVVTQEVTRPFKTEIIDAPDFEPEAPLLTEKTLQEQAAGRAALSPFRQVQH